MIQLRPYDDLSAMAVLQLLDVADLMEVQLVRGGVTGHLALFAEWRAVEPLRLASFVALTGAGTPFAVFGLSHTGQAGVGAAAMLARDHATWRLPLARLAVTIRRALPAYCAERGIHRIEARSWAQHPSASGLLRAMGFGYECAMPGFGPTGQAAFHQYARIFPACTPSVEEQARVL
jgi:hypothetical protein